MNSLLFTSLFLVCLIHLMSATEVVVILRNRNQLFIPYKEFTIYLHNSRAMSAGVIGLWR